MTGMLTVAFVRIFGMLDDSFHHKAILLKIWRLAFSTKLATVITHTTLYAYGNK